MNKKALIGFVPCLFIGLALAFFIPREPLYQWWTLKRWIDVKKRGRGGTHPAILELVNVDEKGVQFFIAGLRAEDPYIREGSAELLLDCGTKALPALKAALVSSDPRLQKGSLMVFEKLDPVRQEQGYLELVKVHNSDDSELRRRAGQLLLDHSIVSGLPKDVSVLAEYRTNLESKYTSVQLWAAYILALNNDKHPELFSLSMKGLGQPEAQLRMRSILALTALRQKPEEVARAFIPLLKDSRKEIRVRVLKSLVLFGKEASLAALPVIEQMIHGDEESAALAWKGLTLFQSKDPKLVPALLTLLNSKDSRFRNWANSELERLGPLAKGAVPALVQSLEKAEELLKKRRLIKLIGWVSGDEEEGALALLPYLRGKDGLDLAALIALEGMTLKGARLREALVKDLEHPTRKIRGWAARVLGYMGAGAAEAVPAIAQALYEQRINDYSAARALLPIAKEVDSVAVYAAKYLRFERGQRQARWVRKLLEVMGPGRRRALVIFEDLLKTGREKRRRDVAGLLDLFGEESVRLLRLALKDRSDGVRLMALKSLQKIALLGGGAVSDLVKAFEQPEEKLRREIAKTLGAVCAEPPPRLLELLKGPNNELKGLVFLVLQSMKARAGSAVDLLFEETKSKEVWVKEMAFDTLWKIGPKSVAKLLILLGSKDSEIRRCAVYALGNIGVLAEDAVPAIKKCLEDEDPNVRKGARFALRKIVKSSGS